MEKSYKTRRICETDEWTKWMEKKKEKKKKQKRKKIYTYIQTHNQSVSSHKLYIKIFFQSWIQCNCSWYGNEAICIYTQNWCINQVTCLPEMSMKKKTGTDVDLRKTIDSFHLFFFYFIFVFTISTLYIYRLMNGLFTHMYIICCIMELVLKIHLFA